jgi:benzoyl-CoA reductase/2-hydroxyglutaryl-CoA dehydratase subunit BcrC/BadD/HgdB
MQRHYIERDKAAREWKKQGGKVVGYFCDSVPQELISAAGLFPLRLSGNPEGSTNIARQHVIPRFTTRENFVHSMLNKLLAGEYDFLDYLIIPHARDSIHRLYQLLVMLKDSRSEFNIPELFFLDTLHTTFFSSTRYEHDRLVDLKQQLGAWVGRQISNESLAQAIAESNESKVLLKQLAGQRTVESPLVSGTDALQVIGSSLFMRREEHNMLLKEFLDGTDNRNQREGARIFVSGSPLDNTRLYEIIESFKATVVAEDHCWGIRYADVLIDESIDPLEAVIERYLSRPPCARMFPTSRRVECCLDSVSNAKAQGVVFNVFKHDSAESWEVPDKIKALKKKGIDSLYLRNQDYHILDPKELQDRIGEFIESVI